jgi:hypothetical protein
MRRSQRGAHFSSAGRSVARIKCHRLQKHLADARRHLGIQLVCRSQGVGLLSHGGQGPLHRILRQPAGQQAVQRRGERIQITALIGTRTPQLFRRGELWRIAGDAAGAGDL